jgi:hypothetical protein
MIEVKFSRKLKTDSTELFELIEYVHKLSAIIEEIGDYTIARVGTFGFILLRIISSPIQYRLNSEFKTLKKKIQAIEANV